MKPRVLASCCFLSLLIGSGSADLPSFGLLGTAHAQELIPHDNGIFSYHRAPRYRESESHPLRTVAYILHPVGWVLREAIYRPFSAFAGSTETTRSVLGFREPFDYRSPLCFNDHSIPDCHNVSPYNAIGRGAVDGAAEDAPKAIESEQQVFFPDVNFEFDKAGLSELGKGRVRQVAQLLASSPSLKVVVEGHTDYKGSEEYNQSLGTRRAESVIKELSEMGVDAARVSSISYGESKPLFTEEEDWARAINRRVHFTVQGEAVAAAAKEGMPAAKAE